MVNTNVDLMILLGKVDAQMASLTNETKRSFKMQEAMQEKMNLISKEIFGTQERLKTLEQRLQTVEKPMAKLQIWQERGVGLLSAICLLSVFVGEAAKSFIEKLVSALP